jgi:hypothetical protein
LKAAKMAEKRVAKRVLPLAACLVGQWADPKAARWDDLWVASWAAYSVERRADPRAGLSAAWKAARSGDLRAAKKAGLMAALKAACSALPWAEQ